MSLINCFFVTRAADANESDPCPAFLVPSVPNWALRLYAASFCATPESVGPRTFLQDDTASSPISSIAITGPELTNCTRLLLLKKKQFYAWCLWLKLWLKTQNVLQSHVKVTVTISVLVVQVSESPSKAALTYKSIIDSGKTHLKKDFDWCSM